MLKKAAALLLICAGVASWVGCISTTNSHYLYAAVPATNQIVAYREDPNSGVLTALATNPVSAGTGVQALALHPSGKFLYAANSGESDVSLFNISTTTGALTEAGSRTLVGTAPMLLVMDAPGSFLYVANTGSSSISVFSIDASSGVLTPVGSPFSIGITPLNMKLAPSGNVLYVTGASGGGLPGIIEIISLTAGVPTNFQFVQTGQVPSGLAINPAGTYLYVGDGAPDNSFWEYMINPDGSLTGIQGSPITETYSNPIGLFIDKSGAFLYAANEGSANLVAFSIGSDGALSLLTTAGSPFTANSGPSVIAADPSGKFLFVGNQASSAAIESFSVDTSSGALISIASYPVGNTPFSIVVTQ